MLRVPLDVLVNKLLLTRKEKFISYIPICHGCIRNEEKRTMNIRNFKELSKNELFAQHMLEAGYERPGWYFWDRTETLYGPFSTREECSAALDKYMKNFN